MNNHITKMQKKFIWMNALLAVLIISGFAVPAHAAQISVSVDNGVVIQNQSVQIDVVLDTQGADANAVQGEITFPPGLFQFKRIRDGGSAVSLWITSPVETIPGTIDFAGIMPGGYTGSNGSLFSLELQPLTIGTGTIQVASATVLANDGFGSPLTATLGSVSISVGAASASSVASAPSPNYAAPNPFTPQIVSDPNIFNGKYFLVFVATDDESGVDHYEVLEVPNGLSTRPLSAWQVATSPYLLTDQSLSSDIYVRAVNHDGNFIVVEIPARHSYVSWSNWELPITAALAVALVLLLVIWMVRRRRRI